jgi:hypothetical protein
MANTIPVMKKLTGYGVKKPTKSPVQVANKATATEISMA